MEVSRRSFLKASGAGLGGLFLLGTKGEEAVMARSLKVRPLKKQIGEYFTICPYDGTGCGFIVASENGNVTNVEGDPEHPINKGGGCSKGQSIRQQAADNPHRLSKVLYRAPGASEWEEKSWDWTIDKIARNIKKTRDESFTATDDQGRTVNRAEALASLGGSAINNEECYLLSKMARAMGIVYLEHHARL